MTPPGEPRRLRADAARNRQSLIDAAQRLFASRGLAVTLDDIAAEAGVNVATAYRHFSGKHDLIAAYVQQQIDHAIEIAERAAAEPDPWQGLTALLSEALALMNANRGVHDVFRPGIADEWLQRLDERLDPVLHDLLDRGRRAGAVRADLQPGDLGVLLQMLAAVRDIPSSDPAALTERYLVLMLDALRPDGTSLPGRPPTSLR